MSSNKRIQESALKILRILAKFDDNRYCFDCQQRGPTYINITIGSFVCTGCSGALRKYNQRVKSISMSNFSQDEINFLKKRGNKACRKIFMNLCSSISPIEQTENFENYLRLKYQIKKWYCDPGPEIEEMALFENNERIDSALQMANEKTTKIGLNAAAGLIILPNTTPLAQSQKPSTQAHEPSLNSSLSAHGTKPVSSIFTNDINQTTTITQKCSMSNNNISENSKGDPFAELIAARPNFNNPIQSSFASFDDIPTSQSLFSALSQSESGNLPTFSTLDFGFQSSNQYQTPTLSSLPSLYSATVSCSQANSIGQPFTSTATVDKYAALAELDGMRKLTSSSVVSTARSTNSMDFNILSNSQSVFGRQVELSASNEKPQFAMPVSSYNTNISLPHNKTYSNLVKQSNPALVHTTNANPFITNPVISHNPFLASCPSSSNPFSTVATASSSMPLFNPSFPSTQLPQLPANFAMDSFNPFVNAR